MSRQCELTGLRIAYGKNVSHAHNKTRRTFTPNIQKKNMYSESLDQMIRLNLSTKAIKSMDFAGGFDTYIISIPNHLLSRKALKIKKAVSKKVNIFLKDRKKLLI